MITHASFRNFKALRSVEIDLQRLTVIVGPNGSGKTSILEGIDVLCRRATNWIVEAFESPKQCEAVLSRGSDGPIEFEVTLDYEEQWVSLTITKSAGSVGGQSHQWNEAFSQTTIDVAQGLRADISELRSRVCLLSLRLDPLELRTALYTPQSLPLLGANGLGLASVIAILRSKHPDVYRRIEANGPVVILLDNLDQGLHPKTQSALMASLRALLAGRPKLQVVATTHSPYVLHSLNFNEVLVMMLREDGSAVCAPLDCHPEIEQWRDAMTPGEFWSHVGEDWLCSQKLVGTGS